MNINTRMFDENNHNVSYICTATSRVNCKEGDTLDLNTIREYTDSYDLVLLESKFVQKDNYKGKKEKYESRLFDYIDINNKIITEQDELYQYACMLLEKEIMPKNVLYDLKLYVGKVLHQVRNITSLSKNKDSEALAAIGKKYKRAYEKATSNNEIPKKEKISVRYHQKKKK